VAGTDLTVVNSTTLTVVSPPQSSRTVALHVISPNGTSGAVPADQFTYLVPAITSLSPNTGPTSGGTTVTITGTHFTGATEVVFGTVAGTDLTVVNDTTITVVSPAESARVAAVHVITPDGTSAPLPADSFTFSSPVITKISPSSGPSTGGTTVTITGQGFTGATGVTFGPLAGTDLTVVNATTITVVSPAESGVRSIHVTTPNGTSAQTTADNYTFTSGA
jgi:hypothetical protein